MAKKSICSHKCFKRVLEISVGDDCGIMDYGDTTDNVVANTELGLIYADKMNEFYNKELAGKHLMDAVKSGNRYSK